MIHIIEGLFMEEHNIRKQVLENVKRFFGSTYKETDGEKYAAVLEGMERPSFPNQDVDELCEKAAKLLLKKYKREPSVEYPSQLIIRKLGKPKINGQNKMVESENQMEKLAFKMANTMAAYEEEIEFMVSHSMDQNGSYDTIFAISSMRKGEEPIKSLIRGVYGRVETQLIHDKKNDSKTIYGKILIPTKNREVNGEERKKESYGSWITTVTSALPSTQEYCVKVRFIPVEKGQEIEQRLKELKEIHDQLRFYSEIDWNDTTGLSSNYGRQENLIERITDKVKLRNIIIGREERSGNYSSNFGITRKQKNKRAEMLVQEMDQELYRLNRALQTQLWKVEVMVKANDEDVIQTVACSMSGALKLWDYDLKWDTEPVNALIAGTKEVIPLMMFPTKEYSGFEFIENEEFSLVSPADITTGIDIGNIIWNGTKISNFYLPIQALNRHAFICGMTGAGKTNTLFNVIEKMDIPFLVIEPVKGEYRSLKTYYPDLKTWVMKAEEDRSSDVSMIRINPFWFPENTNIAFHIDSIKTIIASAFEMSAAMPNILEQCLYHVYIKAGWDIATNSNIYKEELPEEFLYPTFSNLLKEIDDYLDHAQFGDEVLGNYRGAMSTRMKSFIDGLKGILLNTQEHPNYEEFMNGRNIIELEGLADDADKCLVMGTIIVQYYEYLKLHFKISDRRLSHIMIIEEAHRLFKNTKKQANTENGADAAGQLVDSLSNIMAEIRAFGEGLLIVDQSPTKIAEDVIKNSGTKIIHRIDNEKDIKILESSLLIPDDKTSLPALCQGEALIRTEGMTRPCKVTMYCSNIKEQYSLSDSFQRKTLSSEELQIISATMSILSSEEVLKIVQYCIRQVLHDLAESDMENWYETVKTFIVELIYRLDVVKKYDFVAGRWKVIYQIISLAIKRMNDDLSIKEIGTIHLFMMRILDLYYEQRDGYYVKRAAIDILIKYMYDNIIPIFNNG